MKKAELTSDISAASHAKKAKKAKKMKKADNVIVFRIAA